MVDTFEESAAGDARVAAIVWLDDGARLPSGRVIKIRSDGDRYIAYDDATGAYFSSDDIEKRLYDWIEDYVREGWLG